MYTKLHSTTSESQCVGVASNIYISTAMREMSKMPCKNYLSYSYKRKKKKKISAWKVPKISPSI
jgi:hypothetical protein